MFLNDISLTLYAYMHALHTISFLGSDALHKLLCVVLFATVLARITAQLHRTLSHYDNSSTYST